MPTKTEAVKAYLEKITHADLAALYSADMEVQILAAQDGGERVDREYRGKRYHAYSDGVQTWKSIRIPYKADTTPEYTDSEIKWDLAEHAEGIGMTGWDWKHKQSRWVAFDFDAISGHTVTHLKKMTRTELEDVQTAAQNIPWVTIRKSTSGQGLHLYVFLDDISTDNHTEHQAVARAILGKLSALTGFNFSAKVDICGGNMWVWHRKMQNTEGLTLIKQGESLSDIPANWRDHLNVIKKKGKRTIPAFASKIPEVQNIFDELTGQRSTIPLDEDHKKLINYVNDTNSLWWWEQDRHMLVCHTADLAAAHEDLNLKGIFETLATGKEKGGDQNCFAFPLRRGGWAVRRHTPGCAEAATWTQDSSGWTKCLLNVEPDIKIASFANGGIEHPTGGFMFREAEHAEKTALLLGANLELPSHLRAREAKIKHHKDGRLIFELRHTNGDPLLPGWLEEKGWWKRVFSIVVKPHTEKESANYDDLVRHLVTPTGEDCGWCIKSDDSWKNEPLTHIKLALESLGFNTKDVKEITGSSIFKCWTLVNKPFQSEYPGNRGWNRHAAQFRFPLKEDTTSLKYPTWFKILKHCGTGLDEVMKENPWAKAHAIDTGADYLKCWIASLFQFPDQPLPYLFFYGKQNTGKSIFHEALDLLVTAGYQRADSALTSVGGFNGELENAIICIVEETDLQKSRVAYNRIKDWVTARELPVHAKMKTPYHVINTSHWIQCSNDHKSCPIFPGDTRITMCRVDTLDPLELIPKKEIIVLLEKEASDFLTEILNLEIPPSNDRLNVPVVITEDKLNAEVINMSMLELFMTECVSFVVGESMQFSEFYNRFIEWLDPEEVHSWSKIHVGRDLDPKIAKGRSAETNQVMLGNISWEKKPATQKKWVAKHGHLIQLP